MKKIIYVTSLFWLLLFLFLPKANAQNTFLANAKIKVTSTIIANNTNAVAISNVPGSVYSVDGFSNNTTLVYVKLYNAIAANVTCGFGTPQARYMIPFGQSSSGGGFTLPNINGDAYGVGISMCVTTGIADTDTGAPAATAYIVNVHYATQPR